MKALLNNALLNNCAEKVLNGNSRFFKAVFAIGLLLVSFLMLGVERVLGIKYLADVSR